jgi:hypothetical protein
LQIAIRRLSPNSSTVSSSASVDASQRHRHTNCRRLLPGIERAKFWQEKQDGTVALSANGTDPIVTFAVADGDGYESCAPALPLLSLATAGN